MWVEPDFELSLELRFKLQASDHKRDQVMPAFKHQITGQGSNIVEKRLTSCQFLAD